MVSTSECFASVERDSERAKRHSNQVAILPKHQVLQRAGVAGDK